MFELNTYAYKVKYDVIKFQIILIQLYSYSFHLNNEELWNTSQFSTYISFKRSKNFFDIKRCVCSIYDTIVTVAKNSTSKAIRIVVIITGS